MARGNTEYYSRARICDGKKKYTRKHAHNDAKDMSGNGDKMISYKCPYCHHYHVGHAVDFERAEAIGAELP